MHACYTGNMTEHASIHALIRDAIEQGPLGSGNYADVYAFPNEHEGLAPYVLRVRKDVDLDAFLSETSALVPTALVKDMHIGQPLMAIGKKTRGNLVPNAAAVILKRQEGQSVSGIIRAGIGDAIDARQKVAENKIALIDRLFTAAERAANETPSRNLFDTLLSDIQRLTANGYGVDTNHANIFFNDAPGTPPSLSLIDQLTRNANSPILVRKSKHDELKPLDAQALNHALAEHHRPIDRLIHFTPDEDIRVPEGFEAKKARLEELLTEAKSRAAAIQDTTLSVVDETLAKDDLGTLSTPIAMGDTPSNLVHTLTRLDTLVAAEGHAQCA